MTRTSPTDAAPWRLDHLFDSEDAFEQEVVALRDAIDALPALRDGLLASPASLADGLDRIWDLRRRASLAYTYAMNHSHADTRAEAWQRRHAVTADLRARLGQATSWIEPDLQAAADQVTDALAHEPRLAPYRYPLTCVLRRAAHTLSPSEERLLALVAETATAPERTYETFTAAEFPWRSVEVDGEPVRVTPARFGRLRAHPDRALRRQAFDAFFGAYGAFESTLGRLLDTQIRSHWIHARARGYRSCIEAALDADFLPVAIYDTLIDEVRAGLPTLHRYFRLRARMLGLERLGYHDQYVPIAPAAGSWPLERSQEAAWRSVEPLGEAYVGALRAAFDAGWIDPYPRDGKVPGAYMSGGAYGVHPYVLLNHNDDWESCTTLAHEMGHAMHSVLADAAQPFPTSHYTIFVAEIASTFNEALLLRYALERAETREARLYTLGTALDGLRATFFRQTMFAEFERDLHRRVEAGEPLTGASLTASYAALLREYVGDAIDLDDAETYEWAYIPHFYYDFYVWQYATSLAASSRLVEQVLGGEPGAVERYLDLLRAGGSDDAHALLRRAGVDLTSPEPYRAVVRRMDALMDEIEALLASG